MFLRNIDDLESDTMIDNFDSCVSIQKNWEWMTNTNTIDKNLSPILGRFGATISDVELSCLFF